VVRAVFLLRGVNVGGRSTLKMADLRALAESTGLTNVETYLQSGNLVATTRGSASAAGAALRAAVADATSLDPGIATRSASQMRAVVERCPFEQHADVHVAFLVDGATRIAPTVHPSDFEPEQWSVSGRQTYLLLPNGIGRSKLATALSKGRAGALATVRNWRTVTALARLAAD
jgi:uncharacterized protein (DUF1697 family)